MRFVETMGGQDLIAILQSMGENSFTGALEANTSNVFCDGLDERGEKILYARSLRKYQSRRITPDPGIGQQRASG
jgi:hypothetical protein